MKEFICKKDFYIEDVKFASVGDHVILMPDKVTVVNTNGSQKVTQMPEIINDRDYFTPTFETNSCSVEKDNVNHPYHYTQHPSGVECIDITRHYCFTIGNAIKYLWRAGLKKDAELQDVDKEIEDLKKAIWYIKDRINQLSE